MSGSRARRHSSTWECFSPLFIGAWVVGTVPAPGRGSPGRVSVPYSSGLGLSGAVSGPHKGKGQHKFQSPIHRGLGCRGRRRTRPPSGMLVSVPYSSGLGLSGRRSRPPFSRRSSFSPLFIGAWVVGESPSVRRRCRSTLQSPIHRGLGCRGREAAAARDRGGVSFSPLFIGAWVVGLDPTPPRVPQGAWFQSPIHRGLGCRDRAHCRFGHEPEKFQSPIHRGLGCRVDSAPTSLPGGMGFSPLFIGAWVVGSTASSGWTWCSRVSVPYSSGLGLSGGLLVDGGQRVSNVSVPYSSGLRLSGSHTASGAGPLPWFQSPIHRGLGCRGRSGSWRTRCGCEVSVPYSSGLGLSGGNGRC